MEDSRIIGFMSKKRLIVFLDRLIVLPTAFVFHIVWVLAPYTEVWLEEKLTNIESKNKVLRQQAVSMAPNKILLGRSRSILQKGGESGHLFVDTKQLWQRGGESGHHVQLQLQQHIKR